MKKFTKTQSLLVALSLFMVTVLAMTSISFADEDSSGQEINLLEGASYTVYDANGNIVEHHEANTNFDIGSGINVPSLGYLKIGADFWYNGGTMNFYVSMSNGRVQDCWLHMCKKNSSAYYALGYFTALSGNWYGKVTKASGGTSAYYNAYLYNGNSNMICVDSLTAIEN